METCFIGIGSNLGNRRSNITKALDKIAGIKGIKIEKISSIYETMPVGGPHQGKFLNACLKVRTSLSPRRLLNHLKEIEKILGRRSSVRFGPRTIDLDILFYGSRIVREKGLVIPHPRMFTRDFVLKPLREIV